MSRLDPQFFRTSCGALVEKFWPHNSPVPLKQCDKCGGKLWGLPAHREGLIFLHGYQPVIGDRLEPVGEMMVLCTDCVPVCFPVLKQIKPLAVPSDHQNQTT